MNDEKCIVVVNIQSKCDTCQLSSNQNVTRDCQHFFITVNV